MYCRRMMLDNSECSHLRDKSYFISAKLYHVLTLIMRADRETACVIKSWLECWKCGDQLNHEDKLRRRGSRTGNLGTNVAASRRVASSAIRDHSHNCPQ